MKFELASEWPLWLLPICLLLGFAVGWYFYLHQAGKKETSLLNLRILFVVRSLTISLIAFLLIAPFIISREPEIEEPILIYVEDHSQSVRNLCDSIGLNEYVEKRNEILSSLSEKFEIRKYAFGEGLREDELTDFTAKDRLTDISSAIRELENRYENRNVASLILASDGVFNHGVNPLYLTSSYSYPIYTVAMGDTNLRKDARILQVRHNRIAFLGNTFSVTVSMAANLLQGERTKLQIASGGRILEGKQVEIQNQKFTFELEFELKAEEKGIQQFEARIAPIEGEISTTNNKLYFYVEVLESQQNIMILTAAPHPDVGALKLALNSSKHLKAESSQLSDFNGNFDDFDCIVLNQIPSQQGKLNIEKLENSGVPVLYILGQGSDIREFNKHNSGMDLERFNGSFNESIPVENVDFNFFSLNQETAAKWKDFPPLLCPFGKFEFEGTFHSLLFQKIGKVETQYPMIGFHEAEGRKTGVIAGEGIWRWKLYDYKVNGNNTHFNSVVQKIIQYLSIREDRSRFRVMAEASYFENENIILEAEYYDRAFELSNTFPARFNLTNENEEIFNYDFLPLNKTYRLDLGKLEPGDYSWTADLDNGVETFSKSGSFSIKPLQLEFNSSTANHSLLYNLSANYGGEMISQFNLSRLEDIFLNADQFKPIIHYNEKLRELISLKWLFFLILALLSFEWFYRKWLGLK